MPENSITIQNGRIMKRRGRPRPLPPHVNARNLAIEKRRRGEHNEDFVSLARLLPGLANARRLSKVSIVQESIRHLRQQRDMCLVAAREMEELVAENSRLVSQLNALCATAWGTLLPKARQRPVTDPMVRLMAVKDEVYGTFPAGFGDNWAHNANQAPSDGDGATQPIDATIGLSPDQLSTPCNQEGSLGLAPGPTVVGYEDPTAAYFRNFGTHTESESSASADNQTAIPSALPTTLVAPIGVHMEGYTWTEMLNQSLGSPDMVLPSGLVDAWANNLHMPLSDYPIQSAYGNI
ncbi:hypothetical protein BDV06DRAFT_225569 [Aspergillus oleicola]